MFKSIPVGNHLYEHEGTSIKLVLLTNLRHVFKMSPKYLTLGVYLMCGIEMLCFTRHIQIEFLEYLLKYIIIFI